MRTTSSIAAPHREHASPPPRLLLDRFDTIPTPCVTALLSCVSPLLPTHDVRVGCGAMTSGRRRVPTARVQPAPQRGKRVTELVRTACELRAVTAVEGRPGDHLRHRTALRFTLRHPTYGQAAVCPRAKSVTVRIVEKLPKTKDEIQRLIIAELRTCAECDRAWGIVVVPVVDDMSIATWTVSRFHRGQSNAYACDRALQRIVPHYQRLYDLAQKH
jgi:hypothetical protein